MKIGFEPTVKEAVVQDLATRLKGMSKNREKFRPDDFEHKFEARNLPNEIKKRYGPSRLVL
jgi:hypothetical protein